MMINKKNCSLIVLLVLVALPRSSESIFARLTKRSTNDGACEHSTRSFCLKIINDEKGLLQRFHPDVSMQLRNHYKNATVNCRVLLCMMTMYAVITEGEKYLPNSPIINDETFINVIKSSSLADCIDNKNNYNSDDNSHTEEMYTTPTIATVDDKSYTTDSSSNIDFNQFATATTQQDTQSIKSNEIDGSLNESKHEPRKGIIDILYTNENYTNAAKYVNEQTDTELVVNNPTVENVAVEYLDTLETETTDDSTPVYTFASGENERFDLDVANRIGIKETTPVADENTVSASQFVFDSSLITSTSITTDSIDLTAEHLTTSTVSDLSDNDITFDETKRILTFESSEIPTTTNTSALSQVGNVIFQLLGEEGYNSFSCNLTTADEDYTSSYGGDNTMYRRTNKMHQSNASLEKNDFQAFDSNLLPEIPTVLRNDKEIRFLLLKFHIFELCNFTSDDHESQSISKRLILCSNGISNLKTRVHGKMKNILAQYSQDLLEATKKFNRVQESRMKIIKIINLTDYLSSTVRDSDIPKDMKSDFYDLKEFLLVELKNEDLATFHPNSNQKDAFMRQLFDYLLQSKMVDNKMKKLLKMFRMFIRTVS